MSQTNNWYIITGPPCSGKTSILNKLKKKGYFIVEEAARIYIDMEIKKGKTLQQIRSSEISFQQNVLQMKIDIEKRLPKNETIFLERGIPDSDAYYRLCKYSEDQYLTQAMKQSFYKKVFLFELLDYKIDYARTESIETAQTLQRFLEESYKKIGAVIIKVPKMSIDQRLKFILRQL